MRLTPADVHNVAFKKPSIGKRGYDEDEVDAFLDIVEAELTSLIEENNELRQRVAAYESGEAAPAPAPEAAAAAGGADPAELERVAADNQAMRQHIEQLQAQLSQQGQALQSAQQQAAAAQQQPAPQQQGAAGEPSEHHMQAARLLGIAQETAERVTSEATTEAEQTRAAARSDSEQMLAGANNESERLIAEATAKAEALVRDSQIKAEAIDRESQRKYSEIMSQLTNQRNTLEGKIDALRTYEREYRSRLKVWITDQLAQLDTTGAEEGEPAGE